MTNWTNPGRHAGTLSETLGALAKLDSADRQELRRVAHDAEFQGSICGRRYSGDEKYSEAAGDDWGKVADAHRKAIEIIERIRSRMVEAREIAAEMRQAEAAQRTLDEAAERKRAEEAEEAERERQAKEREDRNAAEREAAEAEKARRAALTPAERAAEDRLATLSGEERTALEPGKPEPLPRTRPRPEELERLERRRLEDRERLDGQEGELRPEERERLKTLRTKDRRERVAAGV